MNNKLTIEVKYFQYFMVFFALGCIEWIIGIVLSSNVQYLEYKTTMFIYEWLIIITSISTVITWKKIQGFYLSPFTILYAFLAVFNAGQFIMWGLGIHYVTNMSSELGVATHIRYMDQITLMKIVFVTLPALSFFFAGGILSLTRRSLINSEFDEIEDERWGCYLKRIGIIVLIISYIIAMYDTISNVSIASVAGYSSLYYGDTEGSNAFVKYISYMFFPSFFATYVGYECSKKAYVVLSLIALPYIVLNLIIGDRGSWIYFICLWAWCYFQFYTDNVGFENHVEKRKKRRRIIKLVCVATILLIITTVFYKFREIGFTNITSDDVQEIVEDTSYVFVKPIFEMGQSARCLGIVIQDNLDVLWDGGNTYLAGIASMILPRIKLFFGFYDGYFENWFSQSYIGVKNYGLGFTAIAEAYLNGGIIFYPFYIFAFGFFCGKITKYKNLTSGINRRSLYFVLGSTVTIITACRATMELSLRKWFYGCLVLYAVVSLLANICKRKGTLR